MTKLSLIKRNTAGAPRIVIYGVPGIGKTTLAAAMPSPIFLPVEDGLGTLEVDSFPVPHSYDDVLECVRELVTQPHDYKTLVVDSLDRLEPMLWQHVCRTVPVGQGKVAANIEDYGYGKGYTHAKTEWLNLLDGFDALREKGVTITLIAHSTIARIEPPDTDGYDRYQLRLHKLADAAVCDWADVVLFANYKTVAVTSGDRKRGVSDGSRVLLTTERAAWRAKNRYAMPNELPMDWAKVAEHIPFFSA